jgi:O-antigen ligase
MTGVASGALALIVGHSLGLVLAVGLVLLLVVLALALLMRARPRAFPLLAVLTLPFRVPIHAEGHTANLLIPLYAVIGAGFLAHLLPRLLSPSEGRPSGPAERPPDAESNPPGVVRRLLLGSRADGERAHISHIYVSRRAPMLLDWLLAATVGSYAVQIAYSADHSKGLQNLVFFYLPFGVLYVLLREAPWTRALVLRCLWLAVALAVLCAGVGFAEYASEGLLLNSKVLAANRFDDYFRVNSLFYDPSIYGRFLALAVLAVTAAVLWARERRTVLIGAGVLLWLWAGLLSTFSQSSIVALLVGLVLLAAIRWGVRRTAVVASALAVLGVAFLLAAPASLHLGLKGSEGSANIATNGRAGLIGGGLALFAARPLEGYGSGSFEVMYKRREHVTAAGASTASHTIPVTIAAEQGIVGLALYGALLLAAFFVLLYRVRPGPPAHARPVGAAGVLTGLCSRHLPATLARLLPRTGSDVAWPVAARPALAACFTALVAHTLAYADFLEDPFTWALLAVGVALLPNVAAPRPPREDRSDIGAAREPVPGGRSEGDALGARSTAPVITPG